MQASEPIASAMKDQDTHIPTEATQPSARPSAVTQSTTRPFRRQREARACNACRARKTKCDASRTGQCSSCVSAGIECEVGDVSDSQQQTMISKRLRELEQTLVRVTESIEQIREGDNSPERELPRDLSQRRLLTPRSPSPGRNSKRSADPSPGGATEAETQQTRKRGRSSNGSSSIQTYVTSDGTKAHHFFGSTSEIVFLDSVREHVQQLGYEVPTSGTVWRSPPEVTKASSSSSKEKTNLPAELRAQLPPQALAAKLIEVYGQHVQAHTPMLYWPSILIKFQRIYTRLPLHYEEGQVVADFCILMMVWAIGSQLSDFDEVGYGNGYRIRNGWNFFQAARKLHSMSLIKSTYTLDDAIISLLISIYLLGASLPSPCWVMTGTTSRIVQDLGLHKRPSPRQLFNVEIESRNRLFWGAYMVDRIVALTFGRPVSLLDEDCDVDLPGEADNKGTTAAISLEFFKSSISVVSKLDPIMRLEAVPGCEEQDIETMMKMDAQLVDCWHKYPKNLTDEDSPGSLEPSCLKLIFIVQQARLVLFSRHFTDGALNSAFRNACLKKSVEISRLTARTMLRVARGEQWERSFSHRCNDLVYTHIFRASIVLLLGYQYQSLSSVDSADRHGQTLTQHITILWQSLQAAAKTHFSAAKSLELLQVFADTLNFELSPTPPVVEVASGPIADSHSVEAPDTSSTQQTVIIEGPGMNMVDLLSQGKQSKSPILEQGNFAPTPSSTNTNVSTLHHCQEQQLLAPNSALQTQSIDENENGNGHVSSENQNTQAGTEKYTSPSYANFDPNDVHLEILQGLLNYDSMYGNYLGGGIHDEFLAEF